MEYIDLREVGREGLKEICRQVVRLKALGKTGKEIEELTGVRKNRAGEIWTTYQREGESSLKRKEYGRKAGSRIVLTPEEQESIGKAIEEKTPEDFGIVGKLWALGRTREYIQKQFHKSVSERRLSDYMKRWRMSCQRPVKRTRVNMISAVSSQGNVRFMTYQDTILDEHSFRFSRRNFGGSLPDSLALAVAHSCLAD